MVEDYLLRPSRTRFGLRYHAKGQAIGRPFAHDNTRLIPDARVRWEKNAKSS